MVDFTSVELKGSLKVNLTTDHLFSRNFATFSEHLFGRTPQVGCFKLLLCGTAKRSYEVHEALDNIFEEAVEKLKNKLIYSSVLKKVNGKVDKCRFV